MQGKKDYQEKLFLNFQLSNHVPAHNFYRRLKEVLDLRFLDDIIRDRQVIEHSRMRMDILYFLNYDIDESLPWHSTISRTRQLFPEAVFEVVFSKVFSMSVKKGMVSGHTQVIDAAPIKAKASMENLELKVPEEELEVYLRKVRHFSREDRKVNKATKEEQTIRANKHKLKGIESRNNKWAKESGWSAWSNTQES